MIIKNGVKIEYEIVTPVKVLYDMRPGSSKPHRMKKNPGQEVSFCKNMHRELMSQPVTSYKLVPINA